jgi:hypothetical protein
MTMNSVSRKSAMGTMITQKTRETAAFDRIGSSGLPAGHEGRRLIVNTLIVFAVLALVAYWWFGLR